MAERAGGDRSISWVIPTAAHWRCASPWIARKSCDRSAPIEPVAFQPLRPGERRRDVAALGRAGSCGRGAPQPRRRGMRRFVNYWNASGTGAEPGRVKDKRSGLARSARVADISPTLAEAIPLETYRQIQVPVLLLEERDRPRPPADCRAAGLDLINVRLRTVRRTLDTCCR